MTFGDGAVDGAVIDGFADANDHRAVAMECKRERLSLMESALASRRVIETNEAQVQFNCATLPGPTDEPFLESTERVVELESKRDHVLPTLVTKPDLHEALHAQARKIMGAASGSAGLVVAALKLFH